MQYPRSLSPFILCSQLRRRLELPTSQPQQQLPYKKRSFLFTRNERPFYDVLRDAVAGNWHIFAKVRLADLVEVAEEANNWQGNFNRIAMKHVDFVLCSTISMQPMLVIELDDATHKRSDRRKRDDLVDGILETAGISILHVPVQKTYSVKRLRFAIERIVGRTNPGINRGEVVYAPTSALVTSMLTLPAEPVAPAVKKPVSKPAHKLLPRPVVLGTAIAAVGLVLFLSTFVRIQITAETPDASASEMPRITAGSIPEDDAAGLMLLGTSVVETPVVEKRCEGTVIAQALHLRAGPGRNFESLGTYPEGTVVHVLGKESTQTWVQVKTEDEKTGWMSAGYLSLNTPIDSITVVSELVR